MSDPAILATGVGVRAGLCELLRDVSIRVEIGEVVALVGPNGAGKSTLLSVLAGDREGHAGAVTLLGRALDAWSPAELARVRALLPQASTLSMPFSVSDVVLLGRSPHLVGETESAHDRAVAAAALDAVGLAGLASRTYTTLSGGERQRVHFARVLAQLGGLAPNERSAAREGRLLLLDEPTAALDLAQAHAVLALAREVAAARTAVVVVLHDLNLAAQWADRIVVLDRGRVADDGAPRDVLRPSLLRAVFGLEAVVWCDRPLRCPMVVPRSALALEEERAS